MYLLMLTSLRGLVVRGPMVGAEHAFALVRDWLGESGPVGRDSALSELARRYLAGHGPADERDLAKWSGLALRDARLGAHKVVVTVNGLFRPFALVRGRAVATWRMSAGEVVLKPFGRLAGKVAEALRAEANDVVRYIG